MGSTYRIAIGMMALFVASSVWAETEVEANEQDAARQVQSQVGGRILQIHRVQNEGKDYYRVKRLSNNGEVEVLNVEPPRAKTRAERR